MKKSHPPTMVAVGGSRLGTARLVHARAALLDPALRASEMVRMAPDRAACGGMDSCQSSILEEVTCPLCIPLVAPEVRTLEAREGDDALYAQAEQELRAQGVDVEAFTRRVRRSILRVWARDRGPHPLHVKLYDEVIALLDEAEAKAEATRTLSTEAQT